VFVHEKYRGKGLATLFMRVVEDDILRIYPEAAKAYPMAFADKNGYSYCNFLSGVDVLSKDDGIVKYFARPSGLRVPPEP
jgi:GNAT superfamily N-acetyltransferase